jgi:hypothetical protein
MLIPVEQKPTARRNLSECAGLTHGYGASCGRPWHPTARGGDGSRTYGPVDDARHLPTGHGREAPESQRWWTLGRSELPTKYLAFSSSRVDNAYVSRALAEGRYDITRPVAAGVLQRTTGMNLGRSCLLECRAGR